MEALEALVAGLPERISQVESELADPGLYARDRAQFERLSAVLEAARSELSAAEDEWLALEARREALNAAR